MMTAHQWQQKNRKKWEQLEQLLAKARPSVKKLDSQELYRLVKLHRLTVSDLAYVQSQKELGLLTSYINDLAQQSYTLVTVNAPVSWRNIQDFIVFSFPAAVRNNLKFISLSFACFIAGSVLAAVTVILEPGSETLFLPSATITQLDRGVLWTSLAQASPAEATMLMTHNIQVAIFAFAFGSFFGFGTLLLMVQNGMFALGGPLQVCFQHGMGEALLRFMVAHGAIELSTIFIAGAAGSRLGLAALFPGDLSRWGALKKESGEALVLMTGCFGLLVIAGLIEGLVSLNHALGFWPRLLTGVGSLVFLVLYIGYSGRKPSRKNV